MDATGLLASAVAVGVFPGGLYLVVASAAALLAAGRLRAARLGPTEVAGLAATAMAAALIPLPGAPGRLIPDPGGAAANLLALLLLGGGAIGLALAPRWDAWRSAAALAAGLPLLALAAAASTLSVATVAALPGSRLALARDLAALALLLAAPALVGEGSGDTASRAATPDAGGWPGAAVLAVAVLTAVSVGLPSAVGRLPGVAVAAIALGMVAVAGTGLRGARAGWARRAGATAVIPGLAAVVLAVAGA